jgi:GNAT superfamily N-acetyltransferase
MNLLTRENWNSWCPSIEALFRSSFGREVPNGYLDWRYINNSQKNILFNVEELNGSVIASYSACPVDLVQNNIIFPSMVSMTTMTSPASRGKGLFSKLGNELYEYAKELGVTTVWAFPNAGIHRLRVRDLNWIDIYEVPTLILDVSQLDSSGEKIEELVMRDDQFVLEYQKHPDDGLIRANRTRDYLHWRYTLHPSNDYRNYVLSQSGKVSSYVVTKRFQNGLDLVDIQTSSELEAFQLLSHIVNESIVEKLELLSCWAPIHHFVYPVLERIGFKNESPVTYFGGLELIHHAAPTGWRDYRNWYIQMGDSDVY